jgi:hypothetical protein
MHLDLVKISEILFQGFVQGIVTAITVLAAYFLGKRQADINWRREFQQREKEHNDQLQILNKQLELYEKQFEAEERDRIRKSRIGPIKWNI